MHITHKTKTKVSCNNIFPDNMQYTLFYSAEFYPPYGIPATCILNFIFIFDFRESGREGQGEGEKH